MTKLPLRGKWRSESLESVQGNHGLPASAFRLSDSDISEVLQPIIVVGRVQGNVGLGMMTQSILLGLSGGLRYVLLDIESDLADVTAALKCDPGAVLYAELPRSGQATKILPKLLPDIPHILRLAWDSSILNDEHLEFIGSGVTSVWSIASPAMTDAWREQIPAGVALSSLPMCLDLAPYWNTRFAHVERRHEAPRHQVQFLSIGAFHRRKNHAALIRAVSLLRAGGTNAHLRLHSSLSFDGGYAYIKKLAEDELGNACLVTHESLTLNEYMLLFSRADAYCSPSCGEGCNIPLRQAYARCLPVIFSAIPGHSDIPLDTMSIRVDAPLEVAAFYPEFGSTSGTQYAVVAEDLASNLSDVAEKVSNIARSLLVQELSDVREPFVRSSDFRNSRFAYWRALREAGAISLQNAGAVPTPMGNLLGNVLEDPRDDQSGQLRAVRRERDPSRVVIQAHDGGFFSLFNVFVSHVAWWQDSDRSANLTIVPDWRASTVLRRYSDPTSFCYAAPEDGNSFFRMFELDYVSESEVLEILNKPHLAVGSMNSRIDPWLTYTHAEINYISAEFYRWRRYMHTAALSRISLTADVERVVTESESTIPPGLRIGMHVRHPSHAIEQRSRTMPDVSDYLRVAYEALESHAGEAVVVLATDQESVVEAFRRELGGQVWCRNGVARVESDASATYEELDVDEKMKEGHQIQHLMAQDQSKWTVRNAIDVLVDVKLLASCDDFIHVTSNIATAVAAWNPAIDMGLIRPGDSYRSILDRRRAVSQILI